MEDKNLGKIKKSWKMRSREDGRSDEILRSMKIEMSVKMGKVLWMGKGGRIRISRIER